MIDTDWTDELDDREYPEHDFDDDEPEFIVCSECGADVYEESEQCPACGSYVVADQRIWTGRPIWWIILGLLGIAAVTFVLSLGH